MQGALYYAKDAFEGLGGDGARGPRRARAGGARGARHERRVGPREKRQRRGARPPASDAP